MAFRVAGDIFIELRHAVSNGTGLMMVLDSPEFAGVRGEWRGSTRLQETRQVHVWFNAEQVVEIARRLGEEVDAETAG